MLYSIILSLIVAIILFYSIEYVVLKHPVPSETFQEQSEYTIENLRQKYDPIIADLNQKLPIAFGIYKNYLAPSVTGLPTTSTNTCSVSAIKQLFLQPDTNTYMAIGRKVDKNPVSNENILFIVNETSNEITRIQNNVVYAFDIYHDPLDVGPVGPMGPTGPIGPAGPTGPIGAIGPVGLWG
jgi:hypothetical protein